MKKILIILFFAISSSLFAQTVADVYYVSPTGNDATGNGSIGSPWFTLNKAWPHVSAGDTIYMRGGTYRYGQSSLTGKNGTAGNMINILAYSDERPIINYDNRTFTEQMIGLFLKNANYIHIKGIRVTAINQPTVGTIFQYGLILWDNVNNCIFEQMETDHIGGWGTVVGNNCNNILFFNCDSHHNADPHSVDSYGGSDGFQSGSWGSGYTSTNITYRGCRAWNNSDDGWDLRKADGVYTLENCWSFWNGYKEDGITPGGNGEGFKFGGKSAPATTSILRTIRNCLAFENVTVGFSPEPDLPENNFGVEMYNCTSYKNSLGINFQYDNVGILKNNIIYNNTKNHYYWGRNVTHNHNNLDIPITVSDADFVSVSSIGADGPRQADGSLPALGFLKLASTSGLINAGVDVGLPYNGPAPDLGAYEFNVMPTGIEPTENNSKIKVYPNPVPDELIIEIEGNTDRQGFEILNSTGHIVFKGGLSGKTVVPTTNFSPGVYLIKTGNGRSFEFKKIIKVE